MTLARRRGELRFAGKVDPGFAVCYESRSVAAPEGEAADVAHCKEEAA